MTVAGEWVVSSPCLPPLCRRRETSKKKNRTVTAVTPGGSTKQAVQRGSETVLSPCLGMEPRLSMQLLQHFPSAVVWDSPALHSSHFSL